jgi:ATP-dependent RNA helicase RhlE
MYKRYYKNRFNRNHNGKKSAYEIVSAIRALQKAPKTESRQTENYIPKNNFEDFPIAEVLKTNIAFRKFISPTPIQDMAIPPILEGRDIIGVANTGTGKTAAYLIPLINKVIKDSNQKVLIITPTRELAMQISNEIYGFTYGIKMGWTVCVGGMNMSKQMDDLRKRPGFVIGTPGRLRDLYKRGELQLNEFNNVVLDEADRMVDMGFINEIKFFIAKLPLKRQSLFFSATISEKVAHILSSFVKDPVTVSVKTSDSLINITQELIDVNAKIAKFEKLIDLLRQKEFVKVLIFGRTKWGVQKLSNELARKGLSVDAIHGNKNQGQRQRTLDDFNNNRISILLATDVASRGIDIKDISHVINYDLPDSYEDYIHRIGRTGRADKKGVALTFVENFARTPTFPN